jgi:hypothetical protein
LGEENCLAPNFAGGDEYKTLSEFKTKSFNYSRQEIKLIQTELIRLLSRNDCLTKNNLPRILTKKDLLSIDNDG